MTILVDLIVGTPGNQKHYYEMAGLSTDTKPVEGVAMGSKAIEVDTGDLYLFNEAEGEWTKQFSLQG